MPRLQLRPYLQPTSLLPCLHLPSILRPRSTIHPPPICIHPPPICIHTYTPRLARRSAGSPASAFPPHSHWTSRINPRNSKLPSPLGRPPKPLVKTSVHSTRISVRSRPTWVRSLAILARSRCHRHLPMSGGRRQMRNALRSAGLLREWQARRHRPARRGRGNQSFNQSTSQLARRHRPARRGRNGRWNSQPSTLKDCSLD